MADQSTMDHTDYEALGRNWACAHKIRPIRVVRYPLRVEWRWELSDIPSEFHDVLKLSALSEGDAFQMLGTQVEAFASSITHSNS